jgi:hypothetical protein
MQERTVEYELYERLKLGYDVLSEDDLLEGLFSFLCSIS